MKSKVLEAAARHQELVTTGLADALQVLQEYCDKFLASPYRQQGIVGHVERHGLAGKVSTLGIAVFTIAAGEIANSGPLTAAFAHVASLAEKTDKRVSLALPTSDWADCELYLWADTGEDQLKVVFRYVPKSEWSFFA